MEKIYFSPKNFLCVISTLLLLVVFNSASFAQWVPQGINYQAIARDTAGNPISSNVNLAVKFSIYNDSTSTNPIFTETHSTVTTNQYGLFTRVIGSADTVNFKNIPWGNGDKYLLVEIGEQGQNNFVPMGRTRLMSVPYALYARKAGNAWELDGNRIPLADTALFIGTVNTKDLIIKTDSVERVRVTSIGNVGIGTGTPAAKLDVLGQIKITDGSEGAGKILTSDANGLASWSTGSGTVTSFSADSLQPLFTTNVTNDSTTPALSFTLVNAPALSVFGNDTTVSTSPTYFKPALASALFENQGTTSTVLHGNATGIPSWGQIVNADIAAGAVDLSTQVTGELPLTNGGISPLGTPGQVLTVGGSGPVWANPAVDTNSATNAGIVLPGSGNPDKVWKTDASGNPGWRTDSSNVAQHWTLSGSTLYNNNTGNVGIGTSTPIAKLHILNTTASYGIASYNTGNGVPGYFEINNSSNSSDALYSTTSGTGRAGNFVISNSSNTSAVLRSTTNGTGQAGSFSITNPNNTAEALFVTTDGQNSKALHVNHNGSLPGSNDFGAYITSTGGGGGTSNTGGHFEASGTAITNIGGYFTANGATTNNYAAIFANGKVGIGTTSPVYFTEIISPTTGTTNNVLKLGTAHTNSHVDLVGSGTGGGDFRIRSSGGGNGLTFQTNGNNDRMRIDQNGYVGIGTISPIAPLNIVYNSSALTSGIVLNNSNATNTAFTSILLVNDIGNAGGISLNSSANSTSSGFSGMNVGTNNNTKLQLGTNNLPRVTIDGIGRVGIGIAALAPTQLLEVKDGNLLLSNSGSASNLMFAEPSAGGTNTTSFKAQLQGADITYLLPSTQASSSNSVLVNNGSGTLSWASAGSLGAWTLTGNSGTVASTNFIGTVDSIDFVARTNNQERLRITALGGKVGIGTNSPTEKLHVVGGKVLVGAATASRIEIDPVGTSINQLNTSSNLNVRAGSVSGNLFLGTGTTGNMHFETGIGIRRMSIVSNGNIGIGTTSPNIHGYTNNGGLLTIQNPAGTTYHGVLELANLTDADLQPMGDIAFSATSQTGATSKRSALIRGILAGSTANDRGSALLFYTRQNGPAKDIQERVRIDADGNMGIGTASPASKLDIRGSNAKITPALENILQVASADAISPLALRLGIKTEASASLRYGSIDVVEGGSLKSLALQPSGGNVGIGCTDPQYPLHVIGNLGVTGTVYGTAISMSLGVNSCSDIRYKKNIMPLHSALTNVMKLNGVNYYWKVDEFPKKIFTKDKQVGFIAQDIEKIYPELVFTDNDGFKSVDYSRLTPILVEAIKEQQQIIDSMRKQNEEQDKKQFELIEAMQKEIETLKKK